MEKQEVNRDEAREQDRAVGGWRKLLRRSRRQTGTERERSRTER
jgi:hypothetical protein